LSGVIGKANIMDSVNTGGIGGTYGGNPVSCAAALAVLDIMEKEQILTRAQHIGRQTRSMVQSIIDDCPWIKEVRGIGAMIGIVIIDPDSGEPDKLRTGRIHQYALQHGLIMITAGTYGNVIRTLMPLIIDDHTLAEGLSILLNALKKA
jgi:4-aminobutyrate aminotransferase-like enzyme